MATGKKLPKSWTEPRAKRTVEPAGAVVTVQVNPTMLDDLDRWRASRHLTRAEALAALSAAGLKVFDHATRRR
jgi:hypothetical protein